jgi:vesicle-associated membrane protein 7
MPIKYSCINDGQKLVAEHPAGELPKFATTLQSVFTSVPPKEFRRQTVEDTDVNFHYLSNGDGRIVGCVSTKETRARVVTGFLEAVEQLVRGPSVDMRNSKKLLQSKMEYFNDPANDKIAVVQESVDAAKNIMSDNVDKAMARGDQLGEMHQRSVNLQSQAQEFEGNAQALKNAMCWKNIKMMVLIGVVVTVVIIIIVFIACKPNLSAC